MDYFNNTQDSGSSNQVPTGNPMNPVNPVKPANSLAIASMVLGIISIPALCTVYGSSFLAGIAIILALLSKGMDSRMHSYAKTGIITSAVSLSLFGIIIASAMAMIVSNTEFRDSFMQEYRNTYEQIYGTDFDTNGTTDLESFDF